MHLVLDVDRHKLQSLDSHTCADGLDELVGVPTELRRSRGRSVSNLKNAAIGGCRYTTPRIIRLDVFKLDHAERKDSG